MFGKSQEVNESSKEVPVLTRVGILEIKKDDINYTFGEIPDINVDMKSLIEIVIDYDFQMEIVEGKDKDEFKQVVRDLKSKLSKINLNYESFDTVANTLDKDNVHGLGDVIKKLYNRILFFQLELNQKVILTLLLAKEDLLEIKEYIFHVHIMKWK